MIDEHFVILGALLSLGGALYYCREILAGRVRPNRVSWALWALAPLIAFAAQLDSHVGLTAVLSLSVGIGPALVLLCSLTRTASPWALTRLDIACGTLSLLALALWTATGSGLLAIALSIAADALAAVPTVLKTVRTPESEHSAPYLGAALNGVIALLTIEHWNFATYSFPAYIALLGTGLFVLAQRPPSTARLSVDRRRARQRGQSSPYR